MKFKNLLILFAMLLIGGTASAAIVDGVRQKPVPEKTAFNYGDTLYMYNVGAKMFWGGGNDWNTRASVVNDPVDVVFVKELVNGEWDGKTSILRNWCVQHSRWDNVFVGGADGSMWVDNSSDPNHFWELISQGDEVYRLQVSAKNSGFPGDGTTFVGHNDTLDNGANTRTWAFLTPGEGMNIDWYFVNPKVYKTQLDAYKASETLLAIIEEAKAKGLNVSEQQAVYENESSTIEEINGAIDTLQKLIAALDEFSASVENPSDKTSLITNPSYDANTNDGWSGTKPGFQSYTNAEVYQAAYNSYQDLNGMPNGVYMLQVQAFYRAGWADVSFTNFLNGTQQNASVYAKVGEDSIRVAVMNAADGALTDKYGTGSESEVTVDGVKYYLPNDMNSAATYFAAGRYINTLFFSVEDNKARIGIADKTTANDLAGNWTIWDNWTLTYYGNKEDAFKLWIDNVIAEAPNFDNLPEGKYVTNGMVDTYKAAIEAVSGAATKADILAAQVAIAEAAAVVEKNIAAWDSLVIARNKAEAVSADAGIADTDEKMALGDYVWDLDDMIAALEMTTEELLAEARKVQEMIDYVYANAMLPGTDVTEKFLVNPDYSKGTTGWKGKWGAVASGCMEAYAMDWDAYQEVTSAPVGVYEVSLQGFYRVERGTKAWTMWKNGEQACPGHVYVNNNQTEVPCVFSEPVNKLENIYSGSTKDGGAEGNYCVFEAETLDSLCFPNDMGTAGEAFAKGMYKASAFGLVAKPGDVLRLGVKGKKQSATWVIWDNFKMVYQGFKVEIIKPELEKAIANAKANQDKPMGKEVKKILLDGIIKGTAALALSDGKAMFDALSGLFSINDSVAPSIALFEELSKMAGDMYTLSSTSTAAQDVITAAGTLYAEIMGAIDEGTLEDADAEAYIIKVKEMNTKLRIPSGEASEESPLDMTSVIYTPGFEKDGANSIEGWENTAGYSFGNKDTQKAALMVEFYEKKFDIYQDLVGLPNGMYEVAVQAFCSFGNSATDYDNFTKNPNVNEAWLYAIPASDSTQMATAYLKHRSSEAGPDKGYTGTTTITGANGESLVMPNDMVSSGNYMNNEGLYWNKVIVKVTDGTLRIGVAKPAQIAGDWVIMDNWSLKYFGENSAKTPTGDIVTSIETVGGEAAVVTNVEFFSINGAKMNGLTKGINIMKSTMSDGSVIVKKIVVR